MSIKPKYNNKYQAYVPIMTGCNNFCSYCVVPYARGREISRRTEEIISEIKDLAKNGCKHVMLLGQNVNSYKGENGINFSKLLKKINAIPGKFWISFISSHPKDFDDELIETIAKCKKVCEWVHLPVQAGSDEIIRKMNRHYTQKQYLAKIAKIRKAFKRYKPDAIYSLSSDIIVGFPGETRKQFLESAKVMEKVKYDMVFFGQFSPRPGTAAWKMKDSVSRKEKARRENFLNEILAKTALTNNRKYIGKTVEVLVEKHDGRNYFGKTRTMKNVKIITSRKNLVGKIIKAKIEKASAWNLEGRYGNF
ncbi:MAG: MiaB/RimO family radical SAM methylthiotransferase [Candidatus Moranbacteria bacterium]|nr:MiaB/RimO family radical SAM methylthiotransferase [Candidatus Moranbacteria bacterium]